MNKTHRIVCARSEEPELNMIYAEIGSEDYEIIGAFSGICGGGGLFHVNQDGEAVVSDDFNEFQINIETKQLESLCKELEKLRAEFEYHDDDGNFVGLSELGMDFIGQFDEDDNGVVVAMSKEASEDMIYDIQDEWNLDYYHG